MWSRKVEAVDADGVQRTWHILDNLHDLHGAEPAQTILCVHGNPTWSFLWRELLAKATVGSAPRRVIAVDQLDMGLSERTGTRRRLADRVADLGTLTDALGLRGPIVTLGHDWGGVISLGWALEHRDRLAAVMLTNTAVSQPTTSRPPAAIRLATAPGVLPLATVSTPAFLWTTLALARPRLAADVRAAYLAPYRGRARRAAIGNFVEDIPFGPEHPSWKALRKIAEGLTDLADTPALLMWGPHDPVFGEAHLRDLRSRLPHADLHRFEKAGHLLPEDADVAGTVLTWLDDADTPRPTIRLTPAARPISRPLWATLSGRADDRSAALVEMAPAAHRRPRRVSWALLHRRTMEIAAGMVASGVQPGDRVALLVLPGADLTAAFYACLRIGAVVVVADAGLGVAGLHRAVRSADPAYVIAGFPGLLAARTLGWPAQRIAAGPVGSATRRALGVHLTLAGLARAGAGQPLPPPPDPESDAAVVYTSGSTGPAKGVVYTYAGLERLRDVISTTYGLDAQSTLVAAFAPFALFGPALGITSVVPDMDITAPRTLSAGALADAAGAVDATTVFTSPAGLVNVVATAVTLTAAQRHALARVRLLLSAGAPIPASLLAQAQDIMPNAIAHTPYGMTEVLAVTDVTLADIQQAGPGNGVCVGAPVAGVDIVIRPLDGSDSATGEIAVRAAHGKDRYDRLWATERASSREPGWHRTGDVGHIDGQGRLWVEGRLAHIVSTATGVITPVGIEQRVQTLPEVARAALVGIGPPGCQQVVLVVETVPAASRAALAPLPLVEAVRSVAGAGVAAVLVVASLPTDIRHNSKIDRTRVARWASRVLAGGRIGAP